MSISLTADIAVENEFIPDESEQPISLNRMKSFVLTLPRPRACLMVLFFCRFFFSYLLVGDDRKMLIRMELLLICDNKLQ